ncbi:MAG: hypothetical protein U0289_15625 [Cyclobacteriaceae bacterium]
MKKLDNFNGCTVFSACTIISITKTQKIVQKDGQTTVTPRSPHGHLTVTQRSL